METAINLINEELYKNLNYYKNLKKKFYIEPSSDIDNELGKTSKEIEELQRALDYLNQRFIGV